MQAPWVGPRANQVVDTYNPLQILDMEPSGAGRPEDLFLSHLELIERVVRFVCRRQHLSRSESEEFSSHVNVKLIEGGYAILAKFEGRCRLQTYLTVVIQRLFLDFRISNWGKWRPSAEAVRRGPVALLLERLMTRDGHTFEEAWELLRTNYGVTMKRAELEEMAGRLPVRLRRRFETADALVDLPSNDQPIDRLADATGQRALADHVITALKRELSQLDEQDRLILALRFEDGRAVAEIAEMLRLDQKQLYRRVQRLLKGLRKSLQEEGIDSTSIQEILVSSAVTMEGHDQADSGNPEIRPSNMSGVSRWR